MAGRIRTIKPEVLEDELAAALHDTAWRVWVSSWVMADDYGNFRASMKYLAAQVWQDTSKAPDAVLAIELLRAAVSPASNQSMVFPYIVKGQRYAHIKGFNKHQRQDNASIKPRVPGFEEADAEWFPELDVNLAAKLIKSRRVAASRGERGEFAALTTDLLPPITDHLPPMVAPGAIAPPAATRPRNPVDIDPSFLTEPERAVHTAIVGDESLRPIVRAPAKLAQDLIRIAPGIDVAAQVRQAGAWLRANPLKRKSNGARFLHGWMTREQESRGGRGSGVQPVYRGAVRPGPSRAVQPDADNAEGPAKVYR